MDDAVLTQLEELNARADRLEANLTRFEAKVDALDADAKTLAHAAVVQTQTVQATKQKVDSLGRHVRGNP